MEVSKDNYTFYDENKTIEVSVCSILGDREEQQDSAAVELKYDDGIIAVCDGMGGHSGGKLASSITANTLIETYNKNYPVTNAPDMFINAVDILDERVHSLKNENGEYMAAGTTLTSVVIQGKKICWISVGDSRIYMIRGNEIVQVTTDHNYGYRLDEQLANKTITMQEYTQQISKSKMLISYIGIGGVELMDINSEPLQLLSEDRVLLATDGLFKVLSSDTILKLITNFTNIKDAAASLAKKAKKSAEKGCLDNTTLALIKIK